MKRTYKAPGVRIISVHFQPIICASLNGTDVDVTNRSSINPENAYSKDKGIWDNDHSWNPTWGNEK